MEQSTNSLNKEGPWNKGKLVGQKPPLKPKQIWAIRIRLQIANRIRDLALFNLAIDSKLRACDLMKLRVRDLTHGDQIAERAMVMQQKTQQTVRFEMMQQTRDAIFEWVKIPSLPKMIIFSRVESKNLHIYRHDNMPGLWNLG